MLDIAAAGRAFRRRVCTMDHLYSLYDALVSINVPNEKAWGGGGCDGT
jgi:hypothetical protein